MAPRRPSLPGLALPAVAIAVAGCGVPGGQEEARTTVEAFVRLCAAEEGVTAQELLTGARREVFVAESSAVEGCARALGTEETLGGAQRFREARVTAVAVRGGQGEATVDLPAGRRARVELELVEGRWRIGAPLPPAA
jgi:hypothetical protein